MEKLNIWAKNFKKTIDSISTVKIYQNAALTDSELLATMIKNYQTLFEMKNQSELSKVAAKNIDLLLISKILDYLSDFDSNKRSEILKEAYETGVKKNHDYGSDNILVFGSKGLYVRIVDKLQRFKNLSAGKKARVEDEKIEDTLKDALNYCIYDIMLQNGVWDR